MLPRVSFLIVMAAVLVQGASAATEERSFEFHIPRQAAASALQSLARETNTEVIFSPEQIEGINTQPLIGRFTLSEAVSRLFQGTDLKFNISDKGTIIVTRGNAALVRDQK